MNALFDVKDTVQKQGLESIIDPLIWLNPQLHVTTDYLDTAQNTFRQVNLSAVQAMKVIC